MKRKLLKIVIITLISIVLLAGTVGAAVYTVYKLHPDAFLKMYNEKILKTETEVSNAQKGYLRINGKVLEIISDEGLALAMNEETVAFYSLDEEPKAILYKDSGIEAGSLAGDELLNILKFEAPSEFFQSYEEKDSAQAEMMKINGKECYVTYTHGKFKDVNEETKAAIEGNYTEIYMFQDIGFKTYLTIRISDYSGEEPTSLIKRYTLTIGDSLE